MQKIFSLKPSDSKSIHELQDLFDIGYKVVYATANRVAISGKGDSYNTDTIEGRIVYILHK